MTKRSFLKGAAKLGLSRKDIEVIESDIQADRHRRWERREPLTRHEAEQMGVQCEPTLLDRLSMSETSARSALKDLPPLYDVQDWYSDTVPAFSKLRDYAEFAIARRGISAGTKKLADKIARAVIERAWCRGPRPEDHADFRLCYDFIRGYKDCKYCEPVVTKKLEELKASGALPLSTFDRRFSRMLH